MLSGKFTAAGVSASLALANCSRACRDRPVQNKSRFLGEIILARGWDKNVVGCHCKASLHLYYLDW